jgi:predicted SprT family Zn-dependent metalloprotease
VPLNATLEAALLRELQRTWSGLNQTYFKGQLKSPVLAWTDGVEKLGAWKRRGRTLELSRELVAKQPWTVVVEVLKHEMAHQYVDEALGVHDETAHGPAFQDVCKRLGVDPAAAGMPQAPAPQGDEAKALQKIQRLLALADSPNPHESEAAMKAAHRLMLKYNIAWAGDAAARRYAFRTVGGVKGRFDAHEKVLAGLIGSHFFVRAIWVPVYIPHRALTMRVLELSGTTGNLDIAEWVHGYLLETAERLWRDHQRKHRIQADRERRRYLAGVMQGFYEKLEEEGDACRQEGLVWVGDAGLEDWVGARHPYLRTSRTTVTVTREYHEGRAAGRNIVLRKPIESPTEQRGRLLTQK